MLSKVHLDAPIANTVLYAQDVCVLDSATPPPSKREVSLSEPSPADRGSPLCVICNLLSFPPLELAPNCMAEPSKEAVPEFHGKTRPVMLKEAGSRRMSSSLMSRVNPALLNSSPNSPSVRHPPLPQSAPSDRKTGHG